MNALLLFAAAAILPNGTHRAARPDSVIRDSIYALAVNPADYPKNDYVWLLDEGVYRIEPDGRWVRTFRQVIQILKPQGAYPYREQALTYNPEHQKLTVNWMRVGEDASGFHQRDSQMGIDGCPLCRDRARPRRLRSARRGNGNAHRIR